MRKFNKLLALLLTLTLCLSMAVTANAADDEVTQNVPASGIYISKHLKVATGTTVPDASFTFTFTPLANGAGSSGLQKNETCPAISSQTVTYTAGMEDTGTLDVIVLRTGNILADLSFPHAGVYAYTVAETSGTYKDIDTNKETMTYDSSAYTLRIYVVNSSTGSGVEIRTVTIEKNGKIASTNEGISDGGSTTSDLTVAATNNFKFENTYTKKAGDANGNSLVITNTTVGEYADKTKDFSYELTITKPATTTETEYTYVITKDNSTTTGTGTYGAKVSFTLNDADKVEVRGVVAGSKYTLVQTKDPKYDVMLSVDSADATSANSVAEHLIDENGSSAAFTNTYNESVSPTGISLNNSPFLLMIGVSAMFLLLLLFVTKKRREEA